MFSKQVALAKAPKKLPDMLKGTLQGIHKMTNTIDKLHELAKTDKSCASTLAQN